MLKRVLGIGAGYLAWTVVFLGGSAILRSVMASVHDADGYTENPMALLLYLALSFAASFLAGLTTGRATGATRAVVILAILLLATGIPVQLGAWDRIPVWYNLIFLAMLVPMTLVGGQSRAPEGR